MTHLRTLLTTAFAVTALVGTAAFAQTTATSEPTATVDSVTTLTIDSGATVALDPSVVGGDATDSTTVLLYASNDGNSYNISVAAVEWGFTADSGTNAAVDWPVLSFTSATSTGGAGVATPGADLIDVDNVPSAAVDVATAITNMDGTVTVTLGAAVIQTVVSGVYKTTLAYTIATP